MVSMTEKIYVIILFYHFLTFWSCCVPMIFVHFYGFFLFFGVINKNFVGFYIFNFITIIVYCYVIIIIINIR